MIPDREDWPVHQPAAPEAPIPGRHWYSGCNPDRPRVRPDGICEDCGGRACPECGCEECGECDPAPDVHDDPLWSLGSAARFGLPDVNGGSKPRILDLFSGAGGAAVGYACAGFEVVGVDIAPQPNYPFEFIQADALEHTRLWLQSLRVLGKEPQWDFDAIHASPPCQHYANVTSWRGDQEEHPDLIAPTRELLESTGLPYVIENVRTKELRADFMLCGTAFGLPIRRHRYFETNWSGQRMSHPCQHRTSDYAFDHGSKQPESVYRDAMGCDWMTVDESREAILPVYTEFIGTELFAHLEQKMAA